LSEQELAEARDAFVNEMEKITMLARASRGLAPEPKDAISNLINVKEPLERTGFPTYQILTLAVYLKLGRWRYGPPAQILDEWANLLCSALIAYKRQGRKEWVEAQKRVEGSDQQSFFFGRQDIAQQPQKRRFYQRKPKPEASEFVSK